MITSLCWAAPLTVVRNHGTFSFVTRHQAGRSDARSRLLVPDQHKPVALDEGQINAIDGRTLRRARSRTRAAHTRAPRRRCAQVCASFLCPLLTRPVTSHTFFPQPSHEQRACQRAGRGHAPLGCNPRMTRSSQFGVWGRRHIDAASASIPAPTTGRVEFSLLPGAHARTHRWKNFSFLPRSPK